MRASVADLNARYDKLIKMERDEPFYRMDAKGEEDMRDFLKGAEARCRAQTVSVIEDLVAYMHSLPPACIPSDEAIEMLESSVLP